MISRGVTLEHSDAEAGIPELKPCPPQITAFQLGGLDSPLRLENGIIGVSD